MSKYKDIIPPGPYCYSKMEYCAGEDGIPRLKILDTCPYWGIDCGKPEGMNGYCAYLDIRDWDEENISLLWDKVKECDINIEDE